MAVADLPSPELLRQLLIYEPYTGRLTWRERTPDMFESGEQSATHRCRRWNAMYAGRECFLTENKGYRIGSVGRKPLAAHRVIWAIVTGAWPDGDIDHIDGTKNNNRWPNLRDVTTSQNLKNACRPKNNKTGVIGVYPFGEGRWQAFVSQNNKQVYLGTFNTFEEAAFARKAAERRYGYHPNHGRDPVSSSQDDRAYQLT